MLYSFLLVLLRFGRVFTVPGFVFAAKLSLETFGENRILLSDLILVLSHSSVHALATPGAAIPFKTQLFPHFHGFTRKFTRSLTGTGIYCFTSQLLDDADVIM